MTREQTVAMWLARWQGLLELGLRMSQYAQREGFSACSAYRWRRNARRSGRWVDPKVSASRGITVAKRQMAVQFARVEVSDPPATRSLLLRLVLRNGRRAELEIVAVQQLGEVLDALERPA
jgi:hypothetical protein